MPTIEADHAVTELRTCPLCDTPLNLDNPTECPRCDWVLGYRRRQASPIGTNRDTAAMLLSVFPGLGHIYKGHALTGSLYLMGGAFAIFVCALAATATMGLGLLLIP